MTFWEEHAAREAELDPSAQDAPGRCLECSHEGRDVFFGGCAACFNRWEASR